jgi:hypothetical protein
MLRNKESAAEASRIFQHGASFLVTGRLIMGVLYDYFRASDAKAAGRAMKSRGGPGFAKPAFDCVETKSIDPAVALGKLVAFIRKVPWEVGIVPTTMVSPPAETAPKTEAAYNKLPEDSQWKTGPWLEELGLNVRDTLASVDDKQFPALAAQWAKIEEFGGVFDVEGLRRLIRDLAGLARRARDHDERLYCWMCL